MPGKTSYLLNIIGISCQAIFWIEDFGLTLPYLNNMVLFIRIIGVFNMFFDRQTGQFLLPIHLFISIYLHRYDGLSK